MTASELFVGRESTGDHTLDLVIKVLGKDCIPVVWVRQVPSDADETERTIDAIADYYGITVNKDIIANFAGIPSDEVCKKQEDLEWSAALRRAHKSRILAQRLPVKTGHRG